MARTEDTIKLTISAEDTVVNETVKIVATVSGMVTRESTEATLRESIRQMVKRFIVADWQFSGMQRTVHNSGLEEITLVATARVNESENYALDKRRLEASQPDEGLTISRVTTDVSFPASLVERAEQKLRLDIIARAKTICDEISEQMGRQYRIAKIKYGTDPDFNYVANTRMSASMSSSKTSYGSGFNAAAAGAEDALGNAQKFTMLATITLAFPTK